MAKKTKIRTWQRCNCGNNKWYDRSCGDNVYYQCTKCNEIFEA